MKKQLFLALFTFVTTPLLLGMDAPLPASKPMAEKTQGSEAYFFECLKEGKLEEVTRYLHETNRPVNKPFDDKDLPSEITKACFTPLMIASFKGYLEVVEFLVKQKKAITTIFDADGNTALSLCLLSKNGDNRLKITQCLLESNLPHHAPNLKLLLSQVDYKGLTPLHRASKSGYFDVVKYLIEKYEFNPVCDGTVALSLTKKNNHLNIANYLASKGVKQIPTDHSVLLQNIFYNATANKYLNLDHFDLLAYTNFPIKVSTKIKGFANGGILHIFQPRVFEQSGILEECLQEKLKLAAEKLGGTPKDHEETSPIFGGTCAYHAMKNALVGILLLEDYDKLAAEATKDVSANIEQKAEYVNADIANLTALKTKHFNCEEFLETLYAKIFSLNNVTESFIQPEAITIRQGAGNHSMLIAREKFDHIFNVMNFKRHAIHPDTTKNQLSFIDAETIRKNMFSMKTNPFSSLKEEELRSQIALFRKKNNYRHVFSFSLNTGESLGYGQSIGRNRMHAVTLLLDKQGPKVNAIVFESNNFSPFAIKQILFDFLNLFIDETKVTMDDNECELQALLAHDPFNLGQNLPGSSKFEILITDYHQLKEKCISDKRREDVHQALLYLSRMQHVCNVFDAAFKNSGLSKELAVVETLFKKYSIDSANLRTDEIKLHRLLQEIENKELNERLMTFIMQKDPTRIAEAIKIGANVNYIEANNGYTALSNAVYHGIDIVKVLVEHDADVNLPTKSGKTPLMTACSDGNLEIIEYLVKHGAHINAQDQNGCTPLMYLAGNYNIKQDKLVIAKELIEKYGADLNVKNKAGQNALMVHVICGSHEVFKYLMQKQNSLMDLSILVRCIAQECVTIGITFGPLSNQDSLFEYIAQNYDVKDKTNQALILQIAIAAVKSARIPTIKNLIDKKCLLDINAQDEQGWTLLMHATSINYPGTIEKLIKELHANIMIKNNKGQSALDICIQYLQLNNLDYFVKNHGYSINARDCHGSNPLHHAAAQCNFRIIKNLVEFYKADITATDSQGRTALMLAAIHQPGIKCSAAECKSNKSDGSDDDDSGFARFGLSSPKGHLEVIQFLIENGCNALAKDERGFTVLDYAKQMGNTNVIDYLTLHINSLPK